jgi:hypothetical protein
MRRFAFYLGMGQASLTVREAISGFGLRLIIFQFHVGLAGIG